MLFVEVIIFRDELPLAAIPAVGVAQELASLFHVDEILASVARLVGEPVVAPVDVLGDECLLLTQEMLKPRKESNLLCVAQACEAINAGDERSEIVFLAHALAAPILPTALSPTQLRE
jgi:hypothetical protein